MHAVADTLRLTNLFDSLSDSEFAAVVEGSIKVRGRPGEVIVKEGDRGDELFVILDGSVQVYTQTRMGSEIVLAKLEAGQFFGEQALLPGTSDLRNASVRAFSDATLVKISHDAFQQALSRSSPLRERLLALGEKEARENLLKQSALFRSLKLDQGDWARETVIPDGQIVFSEGDEGDDFYVILSGTAGVYKSVDGEARLVVKLREGQCFGELALIRKEPRSATVVAEGALRVLAVDGAHFMKLYAETPELQDYMKTLQKVYLLPGKGFTTQHAGEFMGHDAITTMYHLQSGRKVLASRVIGYDLFNMDVITDKGSPETWQWRDAGEGKLREILVQDGKVVGATVRGSWDELGDIHAMMLDDASLGDWQRSVFEQKGTLRLEDEANFFEDSDLICSCMQITRGALRKAIRGGCKTAAQLGDETGAGTVCGACIPRLKEMCGRSDWTPVVCAEVIEHTEEVRSFRLRPTAGELKTFKPGQHLVIQTRIEGSWVQRPYTISSAASETDHYEITVKRENRGLFSSWLFEQLGPDSLLRISSPQGQYFLDMEADDPVVCYVGGIGMTPALAMCRSILAAGQSRRLHIDYSAPRGERFACLEELEAAATDHDFISVKARATREDGRITRSEMTRTAEMLEGAVYYICGPETFQAAIVENLEELGVAPERIHVEVFTPQGNKPVPTTTTAVPDPNEFLWKPYALDQAPDQGPDPDGVDPVIAVTRHSPVADQARAYLEQFFQEKGVPEAFAARWKAVSQSLGQTGTYTQTYDEVAYGAKLAWRNASRCVGRLFWQGLQLRDARDAETPDEMFDEIKEHMRLATNGGNLRAIMTLFRARRPDESMGPRVWNHQLIRYAGYRLPDGSILGDPANVAFTEAAIEHGWTPPEERGRFDILPLMLSMPGAPPKLYELPRELCMEVELEHPDHRWFADFGLRWYVLPAVSEVMFSCGGLEYTAAPFNGWYMGTEIGGRNFSDPYRYDMLPAIAEKLGLDTRRDRSLWKDRALVELNIAVLHSFEKRGAKMIDHHAASQDFIEFARQEKAEGRQVSGRWSWLVPPVSGSAAATFHHEFEEHTVLPHYFYQPHPWTMENTAGAPQTTEV